MEDLVKQQEPEIMEAQVVGQITTAETDVQVATAKKWPRSIKEFKQDALSMAIRTPETARACFYVLPRGGKHIEGPSVRLAEIVAVAWGNLRCETRVVGVAEKTVTAQATAWDMQRNVLMRCETSRRITDRNGRRYNDDMITMTGNAAAAIAFRNAIFKVVPMAFVNDVYEKCKAVAAGEGGSIDAAKANWIKYFDKRGVSEARVLALLGKKGLEDVDIGDITVLQGLSTALSEGQTTIEEAFPPAELVDGVQKFGFKSEPKTKAKTRSAKKPKKTVEPEVIPAQEEPPPPSDSEAPWDKHMEQRRK